MTLQRDTLVALALSFVALAFGLGFFEDELATWGDNAQFIVLAQSLATGKGLREINHPEEPAHRKFPPGWPVMLAPFQLLKGRAALLSMKLLVLTLFAGSVPLLFFLLRRWGESRALALSVALLFATNRLSLIFAHQIMSEVPYLACVLLALFWDAHLQREGQGVGRWRVGAVVLTAAWAMSVRSIGVAFVFALLLRWMFARRFRHSGVLLLVAAAFFFLVAWMRSGGESTNYVSQLLLIDFYNPAAGTVGLDELFARVISNVARYLPVLLPDSLLPLEHAPPLRWVALLLISVGLVHYLRRLHVVALYAIFYLGVLMLWPRAWAVHRMVVPLLPFTLLFAAKGCALLWAWSERLTRFERPRLTLALLALALSSASLWNVQDATTRPPRSAPARAYTRSLHWLADHSDEKSVILCRKPYLTYLISKRKTVPLPRARGRRAYDETLKRYGVTHVIYDRLPLPGTKEVLRPRLREQRARYQLLFATGSPRTLVLGVKGRGARGGRR
ncbi:MAG: hypothetical protein JRH20_12205 [Deltaproteobacteria bacterium]|nr:hypothetical protein [Deltaproteobacteria bacterium]